MNAPPPVACCQFEIAVRDEMARLNVIKTPHSQGRE